MKKIAGKLFLAAAMLAVCVCFAGGVKAEAAAKKSESTSVNWLVKKKLLTKKAFDRDAVIDDPSKTITKAEFVKLVLMAADQTDLTDIDFVKKSKPNEAITREEACTALGKLLGLALDLEVPEFADAEDVSESAKRYVRGLFSANIIEDKYEIFEPKKALTWDEAANLVERAYKGGFFEENRIRVIASNASDSETADEISNPTGLTYDPAAKIIYFCDTDNNVIKQVADGKVSILCGRLTAVDIDGTRVGGYVDGAAKSAVFNRPTALKFVSGGLLICDTGNNAIRFYSFDTDEVTTYAGTGKAGCKNKKRLKSTFNSPQGITVDAKGNVFVADTGNNVIRKINKKGKVSTLAGTKGVEGYADGAAKEALFNYPVGIAVSGKAVYVADACNQRIRKIEKRIVTTVAGGGDYKYDDTNDYIGDYHDTAALDARFSGPTQLTVDRNGTIYVSDAGNACIRMIKKGVVSTVEGFGEPVYSGSRNPSDLITVPAGIACSYSEGFVYVADSYRNMILRIEIEE